VWRGCCIAINLVGYRVFARPANDLSLSAEAAEAGRNCFYGDAALSLMTPLVSDDVMSRPMRHPTASCQFHGDTLGDGKGCRYI